VRRDAGSREVSFAQGFPLAVTGTAPLTIPIAGWVSLDAINTNQLKCVEDGGTAVVAKLNPPLPPRMCVDTPSEENRVSFYGWLEIEGNNIATSHCVNLQNVGSSESIFSVQIERDQTQPVNIANNSAEVAICMAIFNPDSVRLKRQIESIQQQSFSNWVCIINDDGSSVESTQSVLEIIGNDSRFHYFRNESNIGFYHNFEMAISRVPAEIKYIALSDQDDYWYENKLDRLMGAMDDSTALVYSDMRITDESGNELSSSYWYNRRNSWTDMQAMLVANTVTGAACLFRSSLKDMLLPFPTRVGDAFHDHWIACCAMSVGNISYVDEALYDYYQYDNSVIGHCGFAENSTAGNRPKTSFLGLLNPLNWKSFLGRLIGSSLAVYWQECRRIESICKNIKLRLPDSVAAKPELETYAGGLSSVWRLFKAHFQFQDPTRLTNNAELRLARGYLVFVLLSRFPSIRGFK
jgi:glycosyltransferase involved in cell wall biosynthesis